MDNKEYPGGQASALEAVAANAEYVKQCAKFGAVNHFL